MDPISPPERNPGDVLEVEIDKMAVGGRGVARHDGLVVFVDGAAPGDVLLVEITHRKPRFAEARIVEIRKAGPGRRTPPCSWAGRCGGCDWQHLSEETQRQEKRLFVESTLRKFLPGVPFEVEETVPSPLALHYRNRVQPRLVGGKLGFSARGSHAFQAVDDCLLVEEGLRQYFREPSLIPQAQRESGNERIELRLDDLQSGGGFGQPNRFQNEDLRRTLIEWTQKWQGDEIWDLYAGAGNFSFPLNDHWPKKNLIAVEGHPDLVTSARTKVDADRRRKVSFYCSDVSAFLRRRAPKPGSLIVLDPPRDGATPSVLRAIAAARPTEIVYISCHPVSLARDLQLLLGCSPRRLVIASVRPFEMFPQTAHVETMVHLVVDTP